MQATQDEKRELAIAICWHWYGRPYRWGGDDPMAGPDCSGLAIEVGKSTGVIPERLDLSSASLFKFFDAVGKSITVEKAGLTKAAFIFYADKITGIIEHVAISLGNFHAIQAAGGGSKTVDLDTAIAQNAFVKIRPFDYRTGLVCAVDPYMV